MIAFLVVAVLVQEAPAIVRKEIKVTIPGQLNPAIAPYLFCTVDALTEGERKFEGLPDGHTKAREFVVETCKASREKAFREADIALKKAGRINRRERRKTITEVLTHVDESFQITTPQIDDRKPEPKQANAKD